ncbi:hypothetical protein SUGI_0128760 [Cryptomeria japonica]|nr:hypothetical protein SUGI_0128760 [Cryptomeria japonica]
MAIEDRKQLARSLSEVGSKLSNQCQSRDDVLNTLKKVEECLILVGKSPCEVIQIALTPIVASLNQDKWLRHPNDEIKLVVTSCLSEIMMIITPLVPYDDDTMKEVEMRKEDCPSVTSISMPSFQEVWKEEIMIEVNSPCVSTNTKEVRVNEDSNTNLLQNDQLNREANFKGKVDSPSTSKEKNIRSKDFAVKEVMSNDEEDWFQPNESTVALGNSCMSLFVGNLEIMLDNPEKVMTSFNDSMNHVITAPLSPHEKIGSNDDEGDSIIGSNIALVLNQQECKEDIIEEVLCESQVLQSNSITSSYESINVHKLVKQHKLENQLKVNEDKIVVALTHFDDTHKLVEGNLWKGQLERRQKGGEEESPRLIYR